MSKKPLSKKKKIRIALIVIAVLIVIGAACFTLFIQPMLQKEEWVYKENTVEYGELQVGVTETGSVTLGETTQLYDIDVSTDEDDDDDDDDDDDETDDKYLKIEEVYVSVGQRIQEGDPVYKFTDASVNAVRKELQYYKTEKEIALAEAQTEKEVGVLTASLSRDETVNTAGLADATYNNTVTKLQTDLTAKGLQVEQLLEDILNLQIGLVDEDYWEQKEAVMDAYDDALDDLNDEIDEAFTNSIEAQVAYNTAKNSYDDLFSQIDQTNQDISDKMDEVYDLQDEIETTQQLITKELLAASQSLETATVSNEIADSKYDSDVRTYENAVEDAQSEVDDATEKLEDFEAFVGDGILYASGTGLVTQVGFEADDKLETQGATMFAFAESDNMTISVDVAQEDVVTMSVGDSVQIAFTAYDEEAYEGTIQSITTTATSTDSATVSYPVVIKILGDTSKLYGGMTADVTFVTEESSEVAYISRKAIVEQDGKSYVYQKKGNGYALTEITTGFTDGVNVEVTSGLSEGDIYYIASVVTQAVSDSDNSAETASTQEATSPDSTNNSGTDNADQAMPGGGMPGNMGGMPQ